MQLILTQDVKNVGKKGELITAADGYARNFLLPKKLAVEATKDNVFKLEQDKKNAERNRQIELEAAQKLREVLKESGIKIVAKTGANGKLFGSITNKEIAEALQEQHNISVDRKKIELSEPIRSLGEFTVPVKIHSQVSAAVSVKVIS